MRTTKYEMIFLIAFLSVLIFTFPFYLNQFLITFSEDYFRFYQVYNSFGEFIFWVIIYYLPAALLFFPKFNKKKFLISLLYLALISFSWWEWFVNPVSRNWIVNILGYSGVNLRPTIAYEFELFGQVYFAYFHAFIAEVPTWLSVFLILFNKNIAKFFKKYLPNFYQFFPSPKHLAIILISTSWLLVWPTIFTLAIWPFLFLSYYKQGKEETRTV